MTKSQIKEKAARIICYILAHDRTTSLWDQDGNDRYIIRETLDYIELDKEVIPVIMFDKVTKELFYIADKDTPCNTDILKTFYQFIDWNYIVRFRYRIDV